jgi:hypothetical protein
VQHSERVFLGNKNWGVQYSIQLCITTKDNSLNKKYFLFARVQECVEVCIHSHLCLHGMHRDKFTYFTWRHVLSISLTFCFQKQFKEFEVLTAANIKTSFWHVVPWCHIPKDRCLTLQFVIFPPRKRVSTTKKNIR